MPLKSSQGGALVPTQCQMRRKRVCVMRTLEDMLAVETTTATIQCSSLCIEQAI